MLPSMSASRARSVHKAARLAAASVSTAPTEADKEAKDDMRAAAAAAAAWQKGPALAEQPGQYAPGTPMVVAGESSRVLQSPATLHYTPASAPMVEFSAPPPPIFDPSLFLSGSLAGASRLPPLPDLHGASHYNPPFMGVQGFAPTSAGIGAPATYSHPIGSSPYMHQLVSAPSAPSNGVGLTHVNIVPPVMAEAARAPPSTAGGGGVAPQTGAERPRPEVGSAGENVMTAPGQTPGEIATSTVASAAPLTSTPAGFPSNRTPLTPPTSPLLAFPVGTPPALRRAGRRSSGIRHRPRIASAAAARTSGSSGGAETPADERPAGVAVIDTAAATVSALPATKGASAAKGKRPISRKAGGRRLAHQQTVTSETDEEEPPPAATKPTEAPPAARLSTDSTPAQGSDSNLGLGESDARKLMAFISSATGLVDTLDDMKGDLRTMRRTLEKQGGKVEVLAVAVDRLKKSPPKFKRCFVDSDGEEYSDYEEMTSFTGTGLAGVVLRTASQAAASAGKKLTEPQEGTLKMLRVRRRVKSRSFGNIGGATSTRDVVNNAETDWSMIMEETKEELGLDDAAANNFLMSDISAPTPRNTPRGTKATKKGKSKDTRRAYQPLSQAISHVLEALKKRVVAAWFFEVGSSADTMQSAEATEWLNNSRIEVGGEQLVKPRFEASERGLKGMLACVKAMFVHLGVKDRIREPTNVGETEHVILAWGHLALAACFVRAVLEQIEAGGSRRRTGLDSGWYDRWRWEVLALKAFVPMSKKQWHGMIISDAESSDIFVFSDDPVPVSGARTLVALAATLGQGDSEDRDEASGAAAASGEATAGAAAGVIGAVVAGAASSTGGASAVAGGAAAAAATGTAGAAEGGTACAPDGTLV